MAECINCKQLIPDEATKCMYCGSGYDKSMSNLYLLILSFIIVFIIAFFDWSQFFSV